MPGLLITQDTSAQSRGVLSVPHLLRLLAQRPDPGGGSHRSAWTPSSQLSPLRPSGGPAAPLLCSRLEDAAGPPGPRGGGSAALSVDTALWWLRVLHVKTLDGSFLLAFFFWS